jgi:DNA-binding NarL/FixJ family response regulator
MNKKLSVALVTKKIAKKAFHTIRGVSVTSPHTLDQAVQDSPDVIIIDDEDMPDDIDCDAKILIVCDSPKEKILQQVHHQGFSGFIQPDISSEEMQKVIRTVQKDEIWVSREIIATVFGEFSRQIKKTHIVWQEFLWSILCAPKPFSGVSVILNNKKLSGILSAREKELLEFIYKGYTNREIAEKLFISEKTVKTHLYNIYRKLNVSRRTEAISLLLQNN